MKKRTESIEYKHVCLTSYCNRIWWDDKKISYCRKCGHFNIFNGSSRLAVERNHNENRTNQTRNQELQGTV